MRVRTAWRLQALCERLHRRAARERNPGYIGLANRCQGVIKARWRRGESW